jgi:FAD/FMN-containing dehydrogenase
MDEQGDLGFDASDSKGLSRRKFLTTAGAVGVGAAGAYMSGLVPGSRVTPNQTVTVRLADETECSTTPPPGFPSSIELYKQTYQNWSGETVVDDVWTCAPTSAADVVTVANWAYGAGYAIRPRGFMHNWAPFTITNAQSCASPIVLLDTTTWLVSMEFLAGPPMAAKVGTGTTMEALLGFLEGNGAGLGSVPAVGQITVGGALAIDGHGAALPASGEAPQTGQAFGSLSNLILSLDAVVWNSSTSQYQISTFDRTNPETKALLTHLGRTFITSVTLQVAPLQNLRCQSYTDIAASTLFATPATAGSQSFLSFIESAGRVEAILYPFTNNPWLKVWTVSPHQPLFSRHTTTPYNYVFSDIIPHSVALIVNEIIAGNVEAAPALGAAEYAVTVAGLLAFLAGDLWGPAKNTQLYIKPSTLRLAEGGGVVLCQRSDIQRVVSEFFTQYQSLIASYKAQGKYPMNGPIEIRATGLDSGADVLVSGAEPPSLSALLQRSDHPEWDSALWLNMLTIPGTPSSYDFYTDMAAWARENYASYGGVRVEWSKGWAYTSSGPWTDTNAVTVTIPNDFTIARNSNEDWAWALSTFDTLDPHRIFSNPLLNQLAP